MICWAFQNNVPFPGPELMESTNYHPSEDHMLRSVFDSNAALNFERKFRVIFPNIHIIHPAKFGSVLTGSHKDVEVKLRINRWAP